ncbi:MAG: mucoidy inhibitor MuiA family protein [Candidatus Hydrogenedentes bacterium]|nr:mucoidy inhibitor MuiA family protein [Candidatus Hydrogenedentota bacterium]
MKKQYVAVLIGLVVLATVQAHAVVVDTSIDHVVVFRDRAEVTRIGRIELDAGDHKLEFKRLVGGLMPESLRISDEGTVEALIGGMDINQEFLEKDAATRTRSLKTQIRDLEDEARRVKDSVAVLDRQTEFLQSLRARKSEDMSKEIVGDKPDISDWQAMMDFLGTNFADLAEKRFASEIRQREIDARLGALRAELNQVQSRAGTRLWNVTAAMSVPSAGTIDVALTYIVHGASWTPIYNARYIEDKKSVDLSYLARVRQATGEDWDDVDVALSTAEPRAGAQIPELHPWRLAFARPVRVVQEAPMRRTQNERGAIMLDSLAEKKDADEYYFGFGAAGVMAKKRAAGRYVTAEADSRGTLVQFAVPGRQSIPADNREHRLTVMQSEIEADAQYVCVPKLSPHCYLETALENTLDVPLLAGPVNVFVGPNFTGQSHTKTIGLGEKFDLSFGVDEGIKVEREEVKNERSNAGMLGRTVRWTRVYRINVAHHKSQPQTIVVRDQMPLSQDEDISVTLTGLSREPTKQTEQGVLEWKFDLNPTQEREIRFGYVVEYPKDKSVSGF